MKAPEWADLTAKAAPEWDAPMATVAPEWDATMAGAVDSVDLAAVSLAAFSTVRPW
jgi:hypothetical protein